MNRLVPVLVLIAATPFFLLLALIMLIGLISPSPYGLPVRCIQFLNGVYCRAVFRLRTNARDPLPREGPCILVANHTFGADPFLLSASTPRLIHFLMAREYYEMPVLSRFFGLVGAIPVKRDEEDIAATKAALRTLKAGRVIGIFPEGRMRKGTEPEPGKLGAAMLAVKSGAPVIPAWISGTTRGLDALVAIVRPARITIRFGEPMAFGHLAAKKTRKEVLEEVTKQIQDRIEELGKAPKKKDPLDRTSGG